jgi:hypothetical protein
MKLWKMLGKVALSMAAVGMLVPNWARAEAISSQPRQIQVAPAILDVSLSQDGRLVGQVLTSEGAPVRAEAVSVRRDGQEIARVATDDMGRYEVRGLRGGVYQVATTQGTASYRVWSGNAAPPAAQPAALMVVGDSVRGQGGGLLGNPWVLGAIAALAIGIGIAASDDDDRPASNVGGP